MTLENKKTHCFACEAGHLQRTIDSESFGAGYEVAVDACANCGATKRTLMGLSFPPNVIGAMDYRRGK